MNKKIFNSFKKLSQLKNIIIPITMLMVIPSAASIIFRYEYINPQVTNIPTVIVNHDDTSTTETLVNQIKANETFNVTFYSDNDDDVKKLIDKGKAAVGLIIPKDFSKDLIDGKAPKIMTFYDGAQLSIVGNARGKIAEVLGTIKTSFLIDIGQGKLGIMPEVSKNSVIPIQYNSKLIGNPAKNMAMYTVQGIVLTIIQVGVVITGILLVNKEDSYKVICIKGIIIALIGGLSAFCALAIQYKYIGIPYRGSIKAGIVLTMLFNIGMTNFGIMLNILKKGDKAGAISVTGIVAATLMMSGYTYPVIAMSNVMVEIARYIPFSYYVVPMRDLSLIGGSFGDIMPEISWLFKFMIVMWIVIFLLYMKNKIIKKDKPVNNSDMEVTVA